MLIPHHLDNVNHWHTQDLLREADLERLARQAPRPRHTPALRARMAALLIALAARIDASTAPTPSTYAVSLGDGC